MKRFPVGLTLAAAFALAVLLGLGVWQVKRLAWKKDLLIRVAALQHAPARPLGDVLASAARGEDVGFVRVTATCAPTGPGGPAIYRYALRDGRVGWRLMGYCALPGAPFGGVVLDRGLVDQFTGRMAPAAASFPPAVEVTGVLRQPGSRSFLDAAPSRQPDGSTVLQAVDPAALALIAGHPAAPYYLAVESERPAPGGLTAAPLPQDIPNNHFAYALTWFALAGVLVWMWAGFVIGRMRGT